VEDEDAADGPSDLPWRHCPWHLASALTELGKFNERPRPGTCLWGHSGRDYGNE
jgi:hypothetical protein